MISESSIDRALALVAIALAPFSSILFAKWLNQRENKRRVRRADLDSDVTVFQAHLDAFKARIEQLEHREAELEGDNTRLTGQHAEASVRLGSLEAQNGKLLRENYTLRSELEECEARERPGVAR